MKRMFYALFAILLAAGLYNPLFGKEPTEEQKNRLKSSLENNDAAFIRNMGQWEGEVLYLARLSGMYALITKDGVVFEHYGPAKDGKRLVQPVRMSFPGSGPCKVTAGKKLSLYHNYLLSSDRSKWKTNVPLYGEVTMEGIYDGVSVRLYFEDGKLRYDIIAEPYADLTGLQLLFEGAGAVEVNRNNELEVTTALGTALHRKLAAYQETDGGRSGVGCSFVKSGTNGVRFDIAGYDRSKTLVIDPLVSATYAGFTNNDQILDVAVTSNYQPIVYGITEAITINQLDKDLSNVDGNCPVSYWNYVIMFKDNCTAKDFITFIACVKDTRDNAAIALDASNNIYIADIIDAGSAPDYFYPEGTPLNSTVSTNSTDYSDGAFWLVEAGGSGFIYTTLIASTTTDELTSIDVDASGNVYLGGYNGGSQLTNIPPTTGAYSASSLGGKECFIVKLTPNQGKTNFTANYVTFFGGASDESLTSLKAMGINTVCFCGTSTSDNLNFPFVNYYRNLSPNSLNGYAGVLNTNGGGTNDLVFSSFIGGGVNDNPRAVNFDGSGYVYLTGYTSSPTNFPVTGSAYDETFNGGTDGFLQVIDYDIADNPIYCTYLGGAGDDKLTDVDVEETCEDVVLTGSSTSTGYPLTSDAFYKTRSGSTDGVITKLNIESNSNFDLIYSSYLGAFDCEALHNSVECSGHIISGSMSIQGDVYIGGSVTGDYGSITTTSSAYDRTRENDEGYLLNYYLYPTCISRSNCTYDINLTYDSLCCNTLTITNIDTSLIKTVEIVNYLGERTTFSMEVSISTQLCAEDQNDAYTTFWVYFYGENYSHLCSDIINITCGCCSDDNIFVGIAGYSENDTNCCVDIVGTVNQSTVDGLCKITNWGIRKWDPITDTFKPIHIEEDTIVDNAFSYHPPCDSACHFYKYQVTFYDGRYDDSLTTPLCTRIVEYQCDSCGAHNFGAIITPVFDEDRPDSSCCFRIDAYSDSSECDSTLKIEKKGPNGYETLLEIPYKGGAVTYDKCEITGLDTVTYRVSLWDKYNKIICYQTLDWSCNCCEKYQMTITDTSACDPLFIYYSDTCETNTNACYYSLKITLTDPLSLPCIVDSCVVVVNGTLLGSFIVNGYLTEINYPCFLKYVCNCTDPMPNSFPLDLYFYKDGKIFCNLNDILYCACDNSGRISPPYNNNTQPAIDNSGMIKILNLYNVPNPASNSTTIYYELSDQCNVTIEVFDVLGNRIEMLKEGTGNKGMNELTFRTDKYQNGVYYVLIKACDSKGNLPVTIIK